MGRSLIAGIFREGGSLRVGEGEEACWSFISEERRAFGSGSMRMFTLVDIKCKCLCKFSKKSKLGRCDNQELNIKLIKGKSAIKNIS